MPTSRLSIVAAVATFALTACGTPGGGGSNQKKPPSAPSLAHLALTPTDAYAATGLETRLTATATYSDASTKDVTAKATWSSSDSKVATVDTSGAGQVTGVAPGTATITAIYQGVKATALVTIGNPVGGAGATVPWVEYQAEAGVTNGTVIGPSRKEGEMAAEASGREAVKLDATGQYVRFTTTARANSIVVRYAIPDAPTGGGIDATLGLYVNGKRVMSLPLTSKYAWLYGSDNSSTFWTDNTPGPDPHHFYDEVHALTAEIPAGATVALKKDSEDTAAYYVIDLVDLEQVAAPLPQPVGSVSITDYGAVAGDGKDDTAAIQQAAGVAQSQNEPLWIPQGTFRLDSNLLFTQSITIEGAGIWYSVLTGAKAGVVTSGSDNHLSHFAIFGDQTARDDQHGVFAISGPEGTGSTIDDIWVEHAQGGAWIVGKDNPLPGTTTDQTTDGLVIQGFRVRDTFADGMDFAGGTSDSVIEQSSFRNTGDDGMGAFSAPDGLNADAGDTFRFDTVQAPWAAHCFAAYGGKDITFDDDRCADSDEGGLMLAAAFNAYPFAGTTTAERDTLLRVCSAEFDGRGCGALTIAPGQKAIDNTTLVQDVLIQDPTKSGVLLTGPDTLSGVSLDNVTVVGAGTDGILVTQNATGSAKATAVVVSAPGQKGLDDGSGGHFTLNRGKHDEGW